MEAANATVKSSFYHPQHLLVCFQYAGAGSSVYACAACELRVTGTGYRCQECDFNIHESCFRNLPQSHSATDLHPHELILTRLDASLRCGLCCETSHRGRYLYRCAPCNYAVHPRCTKLLLVDKEPQPQPQPEPEPQEAPQGERRRINGTREFVLGCTRATLTVCLVVDHIFGENFTPVIEPLRAAVDEMMQ